MVQKETVLVPVNDEMNPERATEEEILDRDMLHLVQDWIHQIMPLLLFSHYQLLS